MPTGQDRVLHVVLGDNPPWEAMVRRYGGLLTPDKLVRTRRLLEDAQLFIRLILKLLQDFLRLLAQPRQVLTDHRFRAYELWHAVRDSNLVGHLCSRLIILEKLYLLPETDRVTGAPSPFQGDRLHKRLHYGTNWV